MKAILLVACLLLAGCHTVPNGNETAPLRRDIGDARQLTKDARQLTKAARGDAKQVKKIVSRSDGKSAILRQWFEEHP